MCKAVAKHAKVKRESRKEKKKLCPILVHVSDTRKNKRGKKKKITYEEKQACQTGPAERPLQIRSVPCLTRAPARLWKV